MGYSVYSSKLYNAFQTGATPIGFDLLVYQQGNSTSERRGQLVMRSVSLEQYQIAAPVRGRWPKGAHPGLVIVQVIPTVSSRFKIMLTRSSEALVHR